MNYQELSEKYKDFNAQAAQELEVRLKKVQKTFERKQKKLEKDWRKQRTQIIETFNQYSVPQKRLALGVGGFFLLGLVVGLGCWIFKLKKRSQSIQEVVSEPIDTQPAATVSETE